MKTVYKKGNTIETSLNLTMNYYFIDDLNKINFNNFVSTDVNQSMNGITNALKKVTNKHAPIRKTSNAQQRLLKKPWLSKGLLLSIKRRQKMFKSCFLSRYPEKVNPYKRYNNKLNKLKEPVAKKNYFIAQFNLYKQNIKATWGLIGMLINMKKKSTIFTNKL